MLKLSMSLRDVSGIGARFDSKLSSAGLETVGDLLAYFPYRFEDFSHTTPTSELKRGQQTVIAAAVVNARNERTPRRRMTITKALLSDATGSILAVWFNQPYLLRQLIPGSHWYVAGKVRQDQFDGRVLQVTALERSAAIFPVYHEHEGLTSKWLRHFVAKVLAAASQIKEAVPDELVSRYELMPIAYAIRQIHQPTSSIELAKAKRRLAIEELLPVLLRGMIARSELALQQAPAIAIDQDLLKQFVSRLPFKLTDDQRKAAWQIVKDLEQSVPMNRLLQGEVGSGKTVVAAMAVLLVSRSGYQNLWLAPTEILANQHYRNVSELLAPYNVSVGLWTAGTKLSLEADLVIGTHALLKEGLQFPKLALVIVDEQHRFGVKQRARLRKASARQAHQQLVPHFLSMTATPIPRTLALTIWGDLDVTVIEQMPEQRKPVVTKVVDPSKRDQAYHSVREQVQEGKQVFVITPLIGEADNREQIGVDRAQPKLFQELERKSAIKEYDKLRKEVFPDLRIGLLHGRLTSKQKNKVMGDFAQGKIDLLVSTAVVEVGIDVPNATVMMIEGADRFGLAQLHQLRGRVGRGAHQSYCLLLPETGEASEHRRLQAMVTTSSGLKLAEYDLKFRGPGELIGTRQHGVPDFKMASLADARLIEEAQQIAKYLFAFGIGRLPELNKKLAAFEKVEHLE